MGNAPSDTASTEGGRQPTLQAAPPEPCRILGVYVLTKAAQTGHGATARTYAQETRWFVRRMGDEDYSLQALNANSIPSGPTTTITKGELARNYRPEPGYYEKRCLPFIESLKKKIALAEKHLSEDDLDGAEKEFCKALLLDEKNPEANIALGKIHLQKGDGRKLAAALRRIFDIDALFQEEERHLFNDFGMRLRKEGHFTEAMAFYGKAVERNGADPHLHFNIARVLADAGDTDAARTHLEEALALSPDFTEARRFLAHLGDGGTGPVAGDAKTADTHDDAPLPDITAKGRVGS
ncbi:Tetratricopeptide TPR_2 repeat-containing protein [Solidesulfovibrio carbinoliphilus subsp. oakridgensis]|uniref:Tetratricopeptide TPR_2 repeat-containing protein n=1 Tax=Solidesulfovibrio carbinoliphilus subsp. oakridgensis TaxID=694327 RepID=G7QBS5_9BACT|nr:tetratricopeptide repeat protein [Solidesulfovibrio carbinoliphilus]EHJ49418.1 Tetratricopeptide TPR_2 repeat-containing protein [Solidesulfovibrio carbinoliphilus subsp. oakridgensis]